MLGRAVQLTFPIQAPGESKIRDSCTADHYLQMALHPSEQPWQDLNLQQIQELNVNGEYLWKDYLSLRIQPPPDVKIVNLETALTKTIDNKDVPTEKGINYHLHMDNFDPIFRRYIEEGHGEETEEQSDKKSEETNEVSVIPVVIALANNHIMDFGHQAFAEETLPFLEECEQLPKYHNKLFFVGVGRDLKSASKPAIIQRTDSSLSSRDNIRDSDTICIVAAGSMDSGIPRDWGARKSSEGVLLLPRLHSEAGVTEALAIIKSSLSQHNIPVNSGGTNKKNKPLIIASIHFGPNWAYRYGDDGQSYRQQFAHALIDECGVDLIHGTSSHHIRGMEVYKGKLIIYGAGDLINDYEGFSNIGDEDFVEHGAFFIVDICKDDHTLNGLTLIPTVMNRLQLQLLCPIDKTRYLWDPRKQSMIKVDKLEAITELCSAINRLSDTDASFNEGGEAIRFRVVSGSGMVQQSEYMMVYP